MQSTTKHCRRCDTTKPRSDFHVRSDRPGGMQARCKACQSELGAERLAAYRVSHALKRKGPKPRPVLDRLLEKCVQAQAGYSTPCWVWTAARNMLGYGKFDPGTRLRHGWNAAHRVAYELFVGPVPLGTELDHLCRNPSCCNPDHLEPVAHAVNVRRGESVAARLRAFARRTHCARGHELTPENEYRWRALRMCRACRAESSKASLELLKGRPHGPRGQDKTHCPRGHEYTDENTRRDRRGCRTCRTCERDRHARSRLDQADMAVPCSDNSR